MWHISNSSCGIPQPISGLCQQPVDGAATTVTKGDSNQQIVQNVVVKTFPTAFLSMAQQMIRF